MSDDELRALLELYASLPRQGPGSAAATRAVLELVDPASRPDAPRIIDAGCGSGASTLVLAEALADATILAVDLLEPLLDRLRAAVTARGLDARVEVRRASMDAIAEPPASVDLIWSEGAIYNVGIEAALRAWAPLLAPGGRVVFSEACWFVPASERPPELVEFWAREYPAMRDEAGVIELVGAAGYTCQATRRLPPEAWLTDYYEPLAARCAALKADADPILAGMIVGAEAEIACFRRFGDRYGYTFFVVAPA